MIDAYGLLAVIVIGLIIGFIANSIMGDGGMGLLWTIVLGLIGSFTGNFILALLGIVMLGVSGQIISGVIGACLLIFIARKLRQT